MDHRILHINRFLPLLAFCAWVAACSSLAVAQLPEGVIRSSQLEIARPLITGSTSSLQEKGPEDPYGYDDFDMGPSDQEVSGLMKSPVKAVLLSLALPGAGEIYAGSRTRGGVFLGAESSIWLAFATFKTYEKWRREDYRSYAALHAGADPNGKDDEFFENMTYYDSRDYFNQLQLVYDREQAFIYPYDDDWYWEWDSADSRRRFRSLRNDSKRAGRRAVFMLGMAALNRIVSAADAYFVTRSYNRRVSGPDEFSSTTVNFRLQSGFERIAVSLNYRF